MKIIFIIMLAIWWLIGFFGHMYWWRKDWDYEIGDLFVGILVGTIGILTWGVGWFTHRDSSGIVIFKRRGEDE